jgi:hypothetical protein
MDMRLFTTIERLPVDPDLGPLGTAATYIESLEGNGRTILRWGLIGQEHSSVLVELALADALLQRPDVPLRGSDRLVRPDQLRTAVVVPTGVGASLGGFIADAGPFIRAVESVSALTIVHPNVVNGADFYAAARDTFYVDGFTLDEFFLGRVRLCGSFARRVGIIIEPMPEQDMSSILNAANAVSAIYGIDIAAYDVLPRQLQARVVRSQYGHFTGEVLEADSLVQSAVRLQKAGVNAIAVVTNCGGVSTADWLSHYLQGGANPIGSLEALISRFITRSTGITAAHAPAGVAANTPAALVVDPRAAGEVASGTGLPSVLLGLSQAPAVSREVGLGVEDLSAVIVPYGCAGGVPAWGTHRAGVRLVAVRSNTCVVGVPADQIGVSAVVVGTPAEALAWLVCVRAGVAWSQINARPGAIQAVSGMAIGEPSAGGT